MFDECGIKELIVQAIDGYAVTVFAFGQTGSGKTFTITGAEEELAPLPSQSEGWFSEQAGIVPRSLRFLFEEIANRTMSESASSEFFVNAAYLEIYNEQVQDLLNPGTPPLPVRWSQDKGFYVENLLVVECEILDDCMAVLEEGLRNRTTGSHKLNERSSRSHSIMTIYIDSETVDPEDDSRLRKHGKISFVDLAGSEKVKESKASGETLTETLSINKSLLTLGNCISALSNASRRKTHIPYRDSKLTKLLSDSLGGHGLALMIACISPAKLNFQETLKTLRYANRAKRIRNKPIVRVDPRERLVMQLRETIKGLRLENEVFRDYLGPQKSSAALALMSRNQLRAQSRLSQSHLPPIRDPRMRGYSNPELAVSAEGNSIASSRLSSNGGRTSQTMRRYSKNGTATATVIPDEEKSYWVEAVENLQCENSELVMAKARADKSYASLLRENERLAKELRRYQQIDLEPARRSASIAEAEGGGSERAIVHSSLPSFHGDDEALVHRARLGSADHEYDRSIFPRPPASVPVGRHIPTAPTSKIPSKKTNRGSQRTRPSSRSTHAAASRSTSSMQVHPKSLESVDDRLLAQVTANRERLQQDIDALEAEIQRMQQDAQQQLR
ncbi:P-loop containing nucleoside triphosphate hydrolase protein [Polychytrium aggregatum]|uniref:P-loop containing nucleoside triphosphate hydrolase protein n=1 Tax=Polychytrium aggregatum TaxID=110093 RepID=UPI0022FE8306|nr:P-loop containing nucleoside triphosphate hydrolase protein [Polychytrium aggregatum]KAI9208466.1 P-loop containing nucleoside triphosphate hydrolase protein [Polychytrium aggregatum]